MRTLSRASASEGQDVRTVQYFLAGQRLYLKEVDGFFGLETEAAVRAYQSRECLVPADGIVGRATLAHMIAQGLPVITDPERDIPLRPTDMNPPTNNEERQRLWGRIAWVDAPEPGNLEAIRITNGFEEKNIVPVDCPVFGSRKVRLHKAVVPHYLEFMEGIIKAGLQSRLITFDGGFSARYIRGSRSRLSNHSWGTAFDVNCDDNPMGRMPALVGEHGSVREFVELGATLGWYWGGWYANRRDGMHFEHI